MLYPVVTFATLVASATQKSFSMAQKSFSIFVFIRCIDFIQIGSEKQKRKLNTVNFRPWFKASVHYFLCTLPLPSMDCQWKSVLLLMAQNVFSPGNKCIWKSKDCNIWKQNIFTFSRYTILKKSNRTRHFCISTGYISMYQIISIEKKNIYIYIKHINNVLRPWRRKVRLGFSNWYISINVNDNSTIVFNNSLIPTPWSIFCRVQVLLGPYRKSLLTPSGSQMIVTYCIT